MPRRAFRLDRALPAALSLTLTAALVAPALAMFINDTEEVPIERLVTNLERRVERQDSAASHYVLGRVHAMAWARGGDTLRVNVEDAPAGKVDFAPWQTIRVSYQRRPMEAADKTHFWKAVHHYQEAVERDSKHALAHLGLGWMHHVGSDHATVLRTPDGSERKSSIPLDERERHARWLLDLGSEKAAVRRGARRGLETAMPRAFDTLLLFLADTTHPPDALQRAQALLRWEWRRRAMGHYRTAFDLRHGSDSKREYFGPEADASIALEAGRGLIVLLDALELEGAEKEDRERLRKKVEALRSKGGPVTPIVFPVDGEAPLVDLVDPSAAVDFDLDGSGAAQRWPWLHSNAALLVWAPSGGDAVTSGRQLFGSVTWWIPWRNGYEPLDALDDDGDGRLAGEELRGLGVWRDVDGDAVATRGEVTDARTYGIAEIATRPDGEHAGVPAHGTGIRLRDGSTRPTYDWTPSPLPPPRP